MDGPSLTLLDGVRWLGDPVPGERGQALLAALALAAPRAVPVGDLVDAVWAGHAPDHPEKALQVQVSRVRSRTGADVVAHVGSGYRIGLRDDEVDALLLRRLLATAREARRAGDLDVARHAAADALGVPIRAADGDGVLGDLVARAGHDQSSASRLLGDVELARGEHAAALPLLERALTQAPDDEALLGQVLEAEAVVRGVPAALERFAAYDAGVRERLGAEPGEALRRVHAELLAMDAPVRQGLKYDAAPMVGRDGDVVAIRALFGSSRVVSVVGAGGLGKTRMAHLVGRLATQPVVHFVELAGVTSPEGVVPEVAGALGVREAATNVRQAALRADLRGRIAEQLSGAPALLILDNCEHLVDAVADLVAYLVATTDGLSVLTTSRAPLGISAEQVYLLPQLGRDDGIELFCQRARAARSDARLDRAEVAALTDRLDGLPLAIELAAAKVRVMAVAEISRRLADRFALLAGRDRSVPDRHQTLESVIAWSWNLLRADDQQALAALAVFPDGFSLDAASAVLDRDAMASVVELVDQSLLVVREDGGGGGDQAVRYRFLETVREYGLKQLGADDAVPRDRMRAWATSFAREQLGRLYSPTQIEAMRALRAETGNLEAEMRRAFAAGDSEAALPLAGALTSMWTIQGEHLTVLDVTEPALDLLIRGPVPRDDLVEYRGVVSALVINTSIFHGSTPPDALARLEEVGVAGDGSRSDAVTRVLLEAWSAGGEASPETLEALWVLCADPDPQVARLALQWTSQILENNGELADALDAGEQALARCDDLDGPWTRALLHAQLCGLEIQRGEWERAQEHCRAAVGVMEDLGAVEDAVQLRSIDGLAEIALGRVDRGAEILEEVSRIEGSENAIGWTVAGTTGQAEVALARGETDRGLALYDECVEFARNRRRGMALDVPGATLPWVLYAESACLFAHVAHGRRERADTLAAVLADKLPTVLAADNMFVDFPVLGSVLVALGGWTATHADVSAERLDVAARSVALGHRFGYHRSLPTMAWARVRSVLDPVAAEPLDRYLTAYAEPTSLSLRPVAVEVADTLCRY